VVASRKSRRFSWGRVRTYQTAGAQAALALENIRLVEQARQSGELEERRRLAGEIHDTLIQGFASIAMNLEAAEGSLGNGSVAAWWHLDEARRTARENLVEARRIVWALGPEALEEAPLHEALARLAQRWSEGSEVFAGVRVTGEPRPLLAEIEVTLVRAAQEALTNVRKHARASRVVLATGYVLKDAPREELYEAIRLAAQGKPLLAPDVAAHLVERVQWPKSSAPTTAPQRSRRL
jgi:signal transduction histidine kinase